jgi:hypothetical protein
MAGLAQGKPLGQAHLLCRRVLLATHLREVEGYVIGYFPFILTFHRR